MARMVTIIGDGAMATICSLLVSEKGYRARMWGVFPEYIDELRRTRENRKYLPGVRFPESVEFTADDASAFKDAFLVVSAVPCQHLRSVWTRLQPYAPRNLPIVSITKGIEVATLQRPTQVIRDVLGNVPVIALSGPNIAAELARKLPATVTAACEDLELATLAQDVFSTTWFRVYTNDDVVGVELAAAMKNVIAPGGWRPGRPGHRLQRQGGAADPGAGGDRPARPGHGRQAPRPSPGCRAWATW